MLFEYTIKQARIDFPQKFFPYKLISEDQRNTILSHYDDVYMSNIQANGAKEALEKLFAIFNIDHPSDFKGHSLSVSDIILLKYNGQEELWFCEPIDWIRIQ